MQIGRRHRAAAAVRVTEGPITTTNYATNGTHLDARRPAAAAGAERRTSLPGPRD